MVRPYNILSIIITIVVCVAMIASMASYALIDGNEVFSLTSPMVYAVLVGIFLVVFLIINVIQELRPRRWVADKSSESTAVMLQDLKGIGLYTVGLLLYVWSLRYLHFLITGCIFMTLGMVALNRTNATWGKKVLFAGVGAIITVPLLFVVFRVIFNVILP